MNRALIRTGLLLTILFVITLHPNSCKQGEGGLDDDSNGENEAGLQSITVTPVPGFALSGGIPNAFYVPGDGNKLKFFVDYR